MTDDQVTQLTAVFESEMAKMKTFMNQGQDREAAKSSMDSSRQETASKIKSILTEEQYSQWESNRNPSRGGQDRMGSPQGM